ncbi:MAG: hypothetical protein ABFS30_14470 [Pseudomonadota bacterium]
MFFRAFLIVLTVAIAGCSPETEGGAELIEGRVDVRDGDSIKIKGIRIRLHGIDAPESQQICRRGQTEWRCGEAATAAFQEVSRQSWGVGKSIASLERGRLKTVSVYNVSYEES